MKLMVATAALLGAAGVSFGGTIVTDFSGFANGASVEGTVFNSGTQAQFTATSTGNNQGLRIFDTTPGGPNDGGPDTDLIVAGFGNALILQDNTGAPPNDANEGGSIIFTFAQATQLVSIGLIDFDGASASTVILTDENMNTRTFSVPNDFTGEPGVDGAPGFGMLAFDLNNQVGFDGNIASFVDSGLFDLMNVVTMEFQMGGSGAIDNLTAFVIPLPTAGAMGLAGLALVGGMRRRAA